MLDDEVAFQKPSDNVVRPLHQSDVFLVFCTEVCLNLITMRPEMGDPSFNTFDVSHEYLSESMDGLAVYLRPCATCAWKSASLETDCTGPEKESGQSLHPWLRATLRVGNESAGKIFELILEADTLSKLLAEQEAVNATWKKYRYVEVVSVASM